MIASADMAFGKLDETSAVPEISQPWLVYKNLIIKIPIRQIHAVCFPGHISFLPADISLLVW